MQFAQFVGNNETSNGRPVPIQPCVSQANSIEMSVTH